MTGPGTAILYYTDYRSVSDAQTESLTALLPAERQAYLKRISHPAARKASLWAGLLLRYALTVQGVPSDGILWGSGKPYFPDQRIHFNLSHAGESAAVLLAAAPCGVDLEVPRPLLHPDVMYRSLFSPEEQSLFPGETGFLRLWTAKEAYQKYVGCGFALPMSQIRVTEQTGGAAAVSRAYGSASLQWFSAGNAVLCACLQEASAVSFRTVSPECLLLPES